MKRRNWVIAAPVVLLCAGALTATVRLGAASASSSGREALAGTAGPAAAKAPAVGTVAGSSTVNFQVVLRLRDQSGAQALVRALSTPGSAQYRQYLTVAQWQARFAPTDAQIAAVSSWLRGEGLTVGTVAKDRLTIAASGSAGQVQSAFGTTLKNYEIDGHVIRQAAGDLSVPDALAGTIAGAIGINQTIARPADVSEPGLASSARSAPAAKPSGVFPPPPAAFIPAPPCSAYYGQQTTTVSPPFGHGYPTTVPDVVCGYKPAQLRSAYGVSSAATGKGTTVAVVDAYGSATIAQDATAYFKRNDPGNPFSQANFTQIDQTPFNQEALCGASGWATEQAIDVESVHSTAPNANILYVGAQNCLDSALFTADQTVIDNGMANVITNSWADTGGDLLADSATRTAYDNLFMLADTTGITVLFSTGDAGDNFALLGFSAANYPSESPFVTGVGGTTTKIDAGGHRVGDLGWDTGRAFLCTTNLVGQLPGCTANTLHTWLPASPNGASGGYTSYNYLQPWYQARVVPAALSERNAAIFGPTPLRVIPDISLDADPGTGFLIGLHQLFPNGQSRYSETRYGGTSLASPLLAGVVADANQTAGVAVGFINPLIYRLDVNNPSAITDVLPEPGPEGNYRVDHAGALGLGLSASGYATSFRELYYSGNEVYCDTTGNCASRPFPLAVTKGYDALTGLGAPGPDFITALAGS